MTFQKRIFAVLYVSVMGLTRCYKTTVFLHLFYKMATVHLLGFSLEIIVVCILNSLEQGILHLFRTCCSYLEPVPHIFFTFFIMTAISHVGFVIRIFWTIHKVRLSLSKLWFKSVLYFLYYAKFNVLRVWLENLALLEAVLVI